MRNLETLEVTRAIVHILEVKKGRKVISDVDIPLSSNPELKEYIADLILAASREPLAKAAKFIENDPKKRPVFYQELFDDDSIFISHSQTLAKQFYDLMDQDKRIADGDLVVCSFMTPLMPHMKFMAIMKLDPMGAFRNIEMKAPRSGKLVDLRKDPYVFSENPDALQKSVFFGLPGGRKSQTEILLLDKQLNRGEIARFFFQDLLGVELLQDSAELTLTLYKCLIDALNSVRPLLPASKEKYLGEQIYKIFNHNSEFSRTSWLNSLQVAIPVKIKLEEIINQHLPGIKSFTLDMTLVNQFTRKRTFSGEALSRFTIPTHDYRNIVRSVEYVTPPADKPYYEVIIHTTRWQEEV